ncbi:MAG: DUF433 domain-containing protein [Spirulina sp.]
MMKKLERMRSHLQNYSSSSARSRMQIDRYNRLKTNFSRTMPAIATKSYIEYRNNGYWIKETRISLDSVVYAFHNGQSPESIVRAFPLLTLEQVYGAIAFYLANRTEIDRYLEQEETAFEEMPQFLQTSDPNLYEKLLAAKTRQQPSNR